MATAISPAENSTVLADAAHILKDPVRKPLASLTEWLSPLSDGLETQFVARLRALRFDPRQIQALVAITTGTAARILGPARGTRRAMLQFLEQVEYNGRRLAKLNLPPGAIQQALQEHDRVLLPLIDRLDPARATQFRWANEQLHFSVLLTLNNAYYQVREQETQAYGELFRIELESRSLHELLRRFLTTLGSLYRADSASLFFPAKDGQLLLPMASVGQGSKIDPQPVPVDAEMAQSLAQPFCVTGHPGQGPLVLDKRMRGRFSSCWSVPLLDAGQLRGVMQFRFRKAYDWLPREQDLLEVAAERCLMGAAKARLMEDLAAREEQVRRLAERMLQVEEMERRRISRELHDEAGQSMLCIRLQLEMIEENLAPREFELKGKLQETRDLTERTILEMRRLIAALSPAVLEQLGLGAALRQLVSRFGRVHPARVRLSLARLGKIPKQTEVIVYRLVQECMNNVGKHSQAERVNISLESADELLRLVVEDDGVGFEVAEALSRRDSYGLAGLRERVALLGGKFYIESLPRGKGKSGSGPGVISCLGEVGARGAFPYKGRFRKGTRIHIELPVLRETNH
jgi:signal transduction histidine kinase